MQINIGIAEPDRHASADGLSKLLTEH